MNRRESFLERIFFSCYIDQRVQSKSRFAGTSHVLNKKFNASNFLIVFPRLRCPSRILGKTWAQVENTYICHRAILRLVVMIDYQ